MNRWAAGALLAATVLLAGACTSSNGKEYKPVGSDGKPFTDTATQVRAVQEEVRRYGNEIITLTGTEKANAGTIRIGPSPCGDGAKDFADDGTYYIAGSWQVNLASENQVRTLNATRDSWQARGFTIKEFSEFAEQRARLHGEDPKTGFTLSIISTQPPTAVAITVASPCIRPPDGKYPDGGLVINE